MTRRPLEPSHEHLNRRAPGRTSTSSEDEGLGAAWRDYSARVRGGELGCPARVLGLVVLVIVFTVLKGDDLLQLVQLREPDHPERHAHRARDGPHLRAAARRDRPVGRLRRRHRGGRPRGHTDPARLPAAVSLLAAPAHRCAHRPVHRPARGAARHPVVRRDAGDVPGPAGLHADHHRRGRHHRHPQRLHQGDDEQQHVAAGGLDPLPRHRGRVRPRHLAIPVDAPQGGPGHPVRAGLGRQGHRPGRRSRHRGRTCSTRSARATRSSPRSRASRTS